MTRESDHHDHDHDHIHFLTLAWNQKLRGPMANPDGKGRKTGDCGDTMEFSLRVEQGCITRISLNIDGCIYANTAAEAVAALCTGKTLEQAWEITPQMVADKAAILPEDHVHCAELAAGTLYLALADCRERKT